MLTRSRSRSVATPPAKTGTSGAEPPHKKRRVVEAPPSTSGCIASPPRHKRDFFRLLAKDIGFVVCQMLLLQDVVALARTARHVHAWVPEFLAGKISSNHGIFTRVPRAQVFRHSTRLQENKEQRVFNEIMRGADQFVAHLPHLKRLTVTPTRGRVVLDEAVVRMVEQYPRKQLLSIVIGPSVQLFHREKFITRKRDGSAESAMAGGGRCLFTILSHCERLRQLVWLDEEAHFPAILYPDHFLQIPERQKSLYAGCPADIQAERLRRPDDFIRFPPTLREIQLSVGIWHNILGMLAYDCDTFESLHIQDCGSITVPGDWKFYAAFSDKFSQSMRIFSIGIDSIFLHELQAVGRFITEMSNLRKLRFVTSRYQWQDGGHPYWDVESPSWATPKMPPIVRSAREPSGFPDEFMQVLKAIAVCNHQLEELEILWPHDQASDMRSRELLELFQQNCPYLKRIVRLRRNDGKVCSNDNAWSQVLEPLVRNANMTIIDKPYTFRTIFTDDKVTWRATNWQDWTIWNPPTQWTTDSKHGRAVKKNKSIQGVDSSKDSQSI